MLHLRQNSLARARGSCTAACIPLGDKRLAVRSDVEPRHSFRIVQGCGACKRVGLTWRPRHAELNRSGVNVNVCCFIVESKLAAKVFECLLLREPTDYDGNRSLEAFTCERQVSPQPFEEVKLPAFDGLAQLIGQLHQRVRLLQLLL